MIEALESALQYAGRNWCVLPCKDKAPLVRGGVHAATRDRSIVERWWRTWPNAEIGIACGAPSGVAVIDIDSPAEVTELFNLTTLCASTPSGGRHLYFRYTKGIRNRVFDWGELRADGLYVVAPPAPGREWINNSVIAELPEYLAKMVPQTSDHPLPEKLNGTTTDGPLMAASDEVPKPLYRKVLRLIPLTPFVTRHRQRRVIGILNIALQRRDHRNDGLNIAAFCLRELICDGIISSTAAEELLIEVAILNGYAAKDGLKAAQATIRSGLGAISGPSSLRCDAEQ
jgi:hypothetical protein